MASNYKIGTMDVSEQTRTFSSFINWSVWGGLLVALGVFGLVLVYGAHYNWLLVAFLMSALGAVAGALLKMPISWYVTLVVIFALCLIGYLLSGFVGLFI